VRGASVSVIRILEERGAAEGAREMIKGRLQPLSATSTRRTEIEIRRASERGEEREREREREEGRDENERKEIGVAKG